MARPKKRNKKIKWKISTETDKDLKGIENLYHKSCELCHTRGSGKHPMTKVCVDCIRGNGSPNFRLKITRKGKGE